MAAAEVARREKCRPKPTRCVMFLRVALPACCRRLARESTVACLVIMLACPAAIADDEPASAANAELADLLTSAKRYEIRAPKSDAALEFREPSLLNFTNPERNQERGSVFVWTLEERPAAIGQFFRFGVQGRRLTKHALHSLSQAPLEARFDAALAWAPEKPGIEWKRFSSAPDPGPTRAKRLLQMRELARRFKLTLIGDSS